MEPSNSQSILKRFLLEIRQLTLRLIEDSLEMEYRAQVVDSNNISSSSKSALTTKSSKQAQQKDITTFMDIEIKSQIYALKEMVTDVDHLFKIDNIRSMLPKDFPHYRNPFMLGKSVDQLADILPPHAEPGHKPHILFAYSGTVCIMCTQYRIKVFCVKLKKVLYTHNVSSYHQSIIP